MNVKKDENQEKMEEAKVKLTEKFGITFPEHLSLVGGNAIYACTKEAALVERAEVKGIRFTDIDKSLFKPSTDFLQIFGHMATKNVIELDKQDALMFAHLEQLHVERDNGIVIVKWEGIALGCGLVKDKLLTPMVSRGRALVGKKSDIK